ncbi:hypothetical protein BG006_010490 [Podila minutissima]|uniref:Uncharacterized protein n=1 Tax=Podila minutissima TaxID=64525 RepID=A0A9P5SFR5_9FUNG|nr:hypothetical protein BG006_010490 [Podila minutissima]
MFDVPELDNMVYMDLDRHSVVQCARVDKKWNKLASSYVFQEIPRLPKKHHQEAFRRIVLEDFLQEQDNAPGPSHRPQPALSKYGHCVRRICNLNNILLYLKPTATKTTKATKKPAKTTKSKKTMQEPSADDLFCHFLKRCCNLQQDELSLTKQHFEAPQKLGFMHHMSLASIRSLSISSYVNSVALTAATLQQVLIDVSSSLESLTLSIPLLHIESSHHAKRHQLSLIGGDDEQDPLADRWIHFQTLKILDIPAYHNNNTIATQFWDWFWPTCSHITSLEVAAFGPAACRHLALGLEHMPHLEKVQFGRTDKQDIVELSDHDLSTMITAATGGIGWNDVRFKSTAHAGTLAFRALLQHHHSTLEELHFVRHADSAATVALLRACPRLRVLAALDNKDRPNIRFPEVDAVDFGDWDAEALAPRPWHCAEVLETLQIKIMGAAHPLQRWDVQLRRQTRVFQRLGRFVNLQSLWLGHEPKLTPVVRRKGGRPAIDSDDDDFYDSEEDYDQDGDDDNDEEEVVVDDPWSERQQGGLPMTWAAGVRSLVSLEKLRELNLSRMDSEFEETVAHWIVLALPNLRAIRGLENREGQMEAYRFLKQWYPKLIRD